MSATTHGSQRITSGAALILDISILVLLISFSYCPVIQTNNASNQLLYATNEKFSGIFLKEATIVIFFLADGETEALRCIT